MSVPRAIVVYARSATARALSRPTLGRQRRSIRVHACGRSCSRERTRVDMQGVTPEFRLAVFTGARLGSAGDRWAPSSALLCSAANLLYRGWVLMGRSTSPTPSRLRSPPLTHQSEILSRHGRCQATTVGYGPVGGAAWAPKAYNSSKADRCPGRGLHLLFSERRVSSESTRHILPFLVLSFGAPSETRPEGGGAILYLPTVSVI